MKTCLTCGTKPCSICHEVKPRALRIELLKGGPANRFCARDFLVTFWSIVSVFFDHVSQFARVEYACDGRPIIVFSDYAVEMALLELELFVIAVLVKNLPQWQETLLAQELHTKGLRYGNELSPEKQLALSGTALQFMEAKELESW